MSLALYNKKRDFKQTSEPSGKKSDSGGFRFVVQEHHASRLHYDFRLELGGVLKSWAVPKGPSMNPADKRLAVQTEDHPVSYIDFKGTIPKGNYGAGKVMIWDSGSFQPVDGKHAPITERAALQALKKGELKVALDGKKLSGEFVLVRLKDEKNWLLIKHRDEYVEEGTEKQTTRPSPHSVPSIKYGKGKKVSGFISPMLASVSKQPFDDKDWIFEIKWDGYRAMADIGKNEVRFYSRNGIDLSDRFPSVAERLQKIKHVCVLDGEVVLINENNLPDFQKLQHYEANQQLPLLYYVFDILSLDGNNMEELPLVQRKSILKKLLKDDPVIRYCDHVEEKGTNFFELAKEKGLEGIMAKQKDSTYAKGFRSKQWLKIKNTQRTNAVIVGYTEPKGGRSHFGSLVLASKKGRSWQYRGHVGTGFTDQSLRLLAEELQPLITDENPFKTKVPLNGKVTWVEPVMEASIGYTEITKEGIFRHPVYLGTMEKKSAHHSKGAKRSSPVKKAKTQKDAPQSVAITNRDKIYWPREGYTKGELIDYYEAVAPYILPHLKNRPMSLKRNPNGIKDEGFYHKDAGEQAPAFVKVFPVESESSQKTIDYIVCNNQKTLLYLANLGCIEMNPWNSRIQKPDFPTWLSIDIDPSKGNSFKQVIEVAQVTKEICDKAGLTALCKTSGASGLHVYLPMKNAYDYETVRNFAHLLAQRIQEQLPDFTTLERSLKKRGKRVYIDYLQNRSGQTLASVYSVRPVDGANVSAALDWKEVKQGLEPSQFTMKNILARLKKKGDIFKDVLLKGNNLRKALKALE
jgi:bifunctional non-homologous end joining protein LigD